MLTVGMLVGNNGLGSDDLWWIGQRTVCREMVRLLGSVAALELRAVCRVEVGHGM